MCAGLSRLRKKRPFSARLFASLPPLVKTISSAVQPSSAATCERARSSTAFAGAPAQWPLDGPKGIGALYIRRGTVMEPLIHGAGHELGRRAGTESALLAAGLGEACEIAQPGLGMQATRRLRDLLWEHLRVALGERVSLNGHVDERLPNTLNVSFAGQVGAEILARMPEVAASTGSACHAGRTELSPVLEAMGIVPEVGRGAIRFSLGRGTTEEEIEQLVHRLSRLLA